jgi:hypothetical protein
MEEFDDVARARASYNLFVKALRAGREILQRAGVPDPPPIPDFDVVFKRLNSAMRRDLYAALRADITPSPAESIQLWQPLIRRAFGTPKQ